MDLEDLMEQVGGFSPYQKRIVAMAMFMSFFSDSNYVTNLLSTEITHYSCNDSDAVSPLSIENHRHEGELDLSSRTPHTDGYTDYSAINGRQEEDFANRETCAFSVPGSDNTSVWIPTNCSKWTYDTSVFDSTAATEFNLVCDDEYLRHLARSAYLFGMLITSLIFGYIGNYYGRRVGILTSLVTLIFANLLLYFSWNFTIFCITQVLIAAGPMGIFQNALMVAVETTHKNWRCEVGFLMIANFGISRTLVVLVAYYLRNWRTQVIVVLVPFIISLPLAWIMPENPRWLLVKGRTTEAIKFYEKAAKSNKVILPESFYSQFEGLPKLEGAGKEEENPSRIKTLLKSKILRRDVIVLYITWMISCFVFYGISMNSANMTGDIYLNVALIMFIDSPGILMAIYAHNKIGRKRVICYALLFAGTVSLCAGLFNEDAVWPMLISNVLGKLGIAIGYNSLALYTAELMPTEYRSLIYGTCSMVARIGGIFSPFVASLADIYKPLPLLITGILSMFAGVLSVVLPETHGRQLPQTLEDYERIPRNDILRILPYYKRVKSSRKGKSSPTC